VLCLLFVLCSCLIRRYPVYFLLQYDKLTKLTVSSRIHFDSDELKAMVAALHFIFLNSAKYDVDATGVLPMELQQLGLPRDICTAIVRAFQAAKDSLRAKLAAEVLRLPRLTQADWRVDYVLASSEIAAADTTNIRLQLHVLPPSSSSTALTRGGAQVTPPVQTVSFALTPAQFTLLYNDLKQAKQMLQHV
jgi:hypothetical protein